MKSPLAFLLYCVLFSTLFIFFYSFISQDSGHVLYEITRRDSDLLSMSEDGSRGFDSGQYSRTRFIGNDASTKYIRQGCPKIPPSLMRYVSANHSNPLTDLEKVLAMCKQDKIMPIGSFFTETMRATLTKIGEGAFADVFGCQKEGWDRLAIKIIPVEGNFKYNDEKQNTLKSIQTELVVSLELSLLGDESRRSDKRIPHYTKNFMQIERVGLSRGKYPAFLIDTWDDFDFRKKSDNDRPDVFPSNQLYVMFSAENSGVQLGSYVYHSFEEAISILQQISITVGVGESALQFEHRDMHRGNVLVRRTHQEYIYFRLDGVEYSIKSYGVMATIVDYTLSRVTQEDTECTSYIDLSKMPWLFRGKGDIQFDVYRNIKNHTHGHWEKFDPYTNVLWLNYLATKTSIKAHLKGMSYKHWKGHFKPYLSRILDCESGKDVFLKIFSPKAVEKVRLGKPV